MAEQTASPETYVKYCQIANPTYEQRHLARYTPRTWCPFSCHISMQGSGSGSITCDLAARVAPGEVVGIDIQESQAAACTLAAQRGIANARFGVGNAYELSFPDASFDVAVARAVLFHMSDPLAARQADTRRDSSSAQADQWMTCERGPS